MAPANSLSTERLLLRQWIETDYAPFAKMSADEEVMRHFPSVLTPEESAALIGRVSKQIEADGWGLWAAESKADGRFVGLVGLYPVPKGLPGGAEIEVGWRLAREFWGKGLATEAAAEALRFGFEDLDQKEIVAFTAVGNTRSRAVMERLNMSNTHQDFDHPKIKEGHPLRRHVLYKITKKTWQS